MVSTAVKGSFEKLRAESGIEFLGEYFALIMAMQGTDDNEGLEPLRTLRGTHGLGGNRAFENFETALLHHIR